MSGHLPSHTTPGSGELVVTNADFPLVPEAAKSSSIFFLLTAPCLLKLVDLVAVVGLDMPGVLNVEVGLLWEEVVSEEDICLSVFPVASWAANNQKLQSKINILNNKTL